MGVQDIQILYFRLLGSVLIDEYGYIQLYIYGSIWKISGGFKEVKIVVFGRDRDVGCSSIVGVVVLVFVQIGVVF